MATSKYALPSYWSQTPVSVFPECSLPERSRHESQGTLFPPRLKWQNSESLSNHGEARHVTDGWGTGRQVPVAESLMTEEQVGSDQKRSGHELGGD